MSRPTVIDSGIRERHSGIEGSNSSISEEVEDLIKALDVVWSLPFHSSSLFLLCPRVFENFLISTLDRPFGFSP